MHHLSDTEKASSNCRAGHSYMSGYLRTLQVSLFLAFQSNAAQLIDIFFCFDRKEVLPVDIFYIENKQNITI